MDLDAIEKAAREAQTRGPWRGSTEQRSPNWHIVSSGTPDGPGSTVAQWCLPADAIHIATSHPEAILEMVAEIRRLHVALAEACDIGQQALADEGLDECDRWLRLAELRKP